MNRMGKREYIKVVAEVLCDKYGSTLKEYGTDIKMAEGVIDVLNDYLYFHSRDVPEKEFEDWKKERDVCNYDPHMGMLKQK